MYSWYDDTSDWAKPGAYVYDPSSKDARDAEAVRAKASGPRMERKPWATRQSC